MRLLLAALTFSLLLSGCFSPHKNTKQRSAIDQQLSSAALQSCIDRLDLSGLERGRRYALNVSAPTEADANLASALLQERLFDEGVDALLSAERGDWTLEMVVHYAGTDLESSLWGIPLFIPGLPLGAADISLYKSTTQTGRARVGLLVWGPSRELIDRVPAVQASRYYSNYSFFTFFGDFRRTNLEHYVEPGDEKD